MPRDLPIGNGTLLITFDQDYCLRDIYYPFVGKENHTDGHKCRFGIWVDGKFDWVKRDWDLHLGYVEEMLITQVTALRELSEQVDTLLFLTVDPGYYGSPFQAHVLKKIEEARHIFPGKLISVDGGISLDNLKIFLNIGVDYVCVGSRIFLNGNPEKNYKKFTDKLVELEAGQVK